MLIAHGLTVMVSAGADGKALPVKQWTAVTDQDQALERRALELVTTPSAVIGTLR